MTIYAGWNARSYTVSFEAVNGADPAAVTVEYGAAYGELPVLTHETLRFLGWFTDRDGGSQVTAETVFENTGDQTLYAHWAEKITIQEEWITVTPQTYDYDENEPGFPVQFAVSVLTAICQRMISRLLISGTNRDRMDRRSRCQCGRISGEAELSRG